MARASAEFSRVSSDLCLLPIYILSYRYKDQVYRFLLNGQTGKLAGDKPVSGQRIAIAVGLVLALILVLVIVAMLVQGPRSKIQSPMPDLPAEAPLSPEP